MKVLFVDLQYDYGDKTRGENTIGLHGFRGAYLQLGYEVIDFFYDDYLNEKNNLQKKLIEVADQIKPDLISFCLFRDQFTIATLGYLKKKYTTINWFGDDQWRFDSFTHQYANYFTFCITTDQMSIKKYHALGQHNIIYSQWAAISIHDTPKFQQYKYDVSFVGGYHPYRKWIVEGLKKKGINVSTFGHGWDSGLLNSEEMNRVFCESKINLNIGNSNSYDLGYLINHPKNILYSLKSKKNSSQIKARNFEIPFFGGFQLTDYVPTLEQYFNIGTEIVCYSTQDDIYNQVAYYLENNQERECIKKAGTQRSVSEHGYINRFREIMEQVREKNSTGC